MDNELQAQEFLEVTTAQLVSVATGRSTTEPVGDIFDDIIDWIISQAEKVIDVVIRWVGWAWDAICETVTEWVSWAVDTITDWIDTAIDWVRSAYDWIRYTYDALADWISDAWDTVYNACKSAIFTVSQWIDDAVDDITDWITSRVQNVINWITTTVNKLTSTISGWFSEQWTNITALFSTWGDAIGDWFTNLTTTISTYFSNLTLQLEAGWEWLITEIETRVVEPLTTWWAEFLGKVLDFPSWIGSLVDSIWAWFTEDIPGSSERGEGILAAIWRWLYAFFTRPKEIAEGPLGAQFFYSFNKLTGWLGDTFNTVVTGFMEAVEGFINTLGPTNPDIATDHYRSISSIGMTALAGLAGMTVASSWMKPLGGAGMGQIAAMIYDMTNYKVITGAAITALTFAAIRTPMTYHFNELFRPFLLPNRDFFELMSRKAWTDPESLQEPSLTTSIQALTKGDGAAYESKIIGYYGYPEVYHGIFKELANAPLRYFPLAGIARTGFFEKVWFTEALHRSGYSKTAVDALMVMYKKMVDENVQGSMSGAAVKRFKEGLTTEEQFSGELTMLGYSLEQIPKYTAAAKMDYAYDYIMDLLSAYRDAVRKGNLSLDEYRGALLGLGMVPERVEGYILRERARLRPGEPLTPLAPPTPEYETDAGKVKVDTIRRERRKRLISKDQEVAGLLALGMEVGLATAIGENDNIRLAEKVEAE